MNIISREKEVLWRENKYEVMSHSENHYKYIKKSLQDISLEKLTEVITEAKKIEKTTGSVTNAYQHMWGYFKKQAIEEEKNKTFELLEDFQKTNEQEKTLWKWLAHLAVKYEQKYLLQSTIIVKHIDLTN